jgi:photosystem II stability/assembly factor-like uncharacterized protein
MRLLNTLLIIFSFLSAAIINCSTGGEHQDLPLNLEGQWAESSLTSQSISRVKVYNAILYASTTKGLYRQERSSLSPAWQSLGLQEAEVRDFVVWNPSEILASAEFPDSTTFIFRTLSGGTKWEPFQNGFGGDTQRIPSTLEKGLQNTNIIFARRGSNVAKSKDKGKNWNSIYLEWGSLGAGPFIQQSKNVIWAGGANAIFEPQLFKSTDGGGTWERLAILENVETTVFDVATHPSDNNTVIAGLGIGIRKSTDGGRSWTTTFDQAGIYTLAHSARDGRIVYAAGTTRNGRLSFFASGDFGDTWQTVEFESGPTQIRVNDMISVLENGKEVLYFGTNKGVYSFTFEQ